MDERPDRDRVLALLTEALSLPPRERTAFINTRTGKDSELREELLQLISIPIPPAPAPDQLTRSMSQAVRELVEPPPPFAPEAAPFLDVLRESGSVFSRYTDFEVIGRGGSATVYAARDRALGRRVAIKMLPNAIEQPPSEVSALFLREMSVLASLHHPHILPIFDYGLAQDGHPYYVTQLLEGGTLADSFAAQTETRGGVALRRLAADLTRIAGAAAHANGRGVLHRDITPRNILFAGDSRMPYLADWGIARSTGDGGRTDDSPIGTAWYMAPEQARGEHQRCSTSSEVYALGAILYEGITGSPPHRANLGATQHNTEELLAHLGQAPTIPRPRGASRELTAICMRSLAKDPKQRYPDCSAFARELQRWLEQRPVSAVSNNPAYRIQKGIQRRPGIAVGLAFTALVIASGAGATSTILAKTNRALETRERISTATTNYLTHIFSRANPFSQPESDLRASELLDKGLEDLHEELGGVPEVQARMQHILGGALLDLGYPKKAEKPIEASYRYFLERPDSPPDFRLDAMEHYAVLLKSKHELCAAEELLTSVIEERTQRFGPRAIDTLQAHLTLASLYFERIDYDRSLAELASVEALVPAPGASGYFFALEIPTLKAQCLRGLGRNEESLKEIERAIDQYTEVANPLHPRALYARMERVYCLGAVGRQDEQEAELAALVQDAKTVFGADSPVMLGFLNNWAQCLSSLGRAQEMIEVQEEIQSSALAYFGPANRHTLTATNNLGGSYLQVGRMEEAEDMLEFALEGRRRTLDENHPEIADTLSLLGQLHGMRGDMATAESLFVEALRISSVARGPSHPSSIAHLRSQAVAIRNQERFDEALVLFSRAKRLATGSETARVELRILERSLIICYLRAGRRPEAEEEAHNLLEACVDDPQALADARQFLTDQGLEVP